MKNVERTSQVEFKSAAGAAGVGGFFLGSGLLLGAVNLAMSAPAHVKNPILLLSTIVAVSGALLINEARKHYGDGFNKMPAP